MADAGTTEPPAAAATEPPAAAAAPAPPSSSMRTLAELRDEWLKRRTRHPGSQEEKPAERGGEGPASRGGRCRRGGQGKVFKCDEAGAAILRMPQATSYPPEALLAMRPRLGLRPEGLPVTVCLRREAPREARVKGSREVERPADEVECRICSDQDGSAEKALPAALDLLAADSDALGLEADFFFASGSDGDEDLEEAEDKGAALQQSRGFSKWFASAAAPSLAAEALLSTDGEGSGETSSEEDAIAREDSVSRAVSVVA